MDSYLFLLKTTEKIVVFLAFVFVAIAVVLASFFCFVFFFLLDGIGNANYRRPGTLAIWPYPAPLAAMFLLLGRKEKSGFSFTCPTQC